MNQPLYITVASLVCPVGYAPDSAAAAMRAGISAFSELAYMDNTGEPIVGAVVPGLPEDLRGRPRLVKLLSLAFELLESSLPKGIDIKNVPNILCTRESDHPGAKVTDILSEIEGIPIDCYGSKQIASDHVSSFEAIKHARQLIFEGRTTTCLVIAVDTLVDARTLNWLDQAKRLKTAEQTDGVIPGEAACIAIVSNRAMTPSSLAIKGLGYSNETATVLNDEPFLGKGMAAAVKDALKEASLAMHEVDFRLSDVGGESYTFEELVLTQSRLAIKVRKSQVLWHPADSIGDSGAAAGLIQFAWAEQAFARKYAPGPVALLHGSSTTGGRAAAVVGIGD